MTDARQPAIGEIWREADPRKERYVMVTALSEPEGGPLLSTVKERRVRILTVSRVGALWLADRGAQNTWASFARFNGKSGGYIFEENR